MEKGGDAYVCGCCGSGCCGGRCYGGWGGHGHSLLRIVIVLFLFAVVFWMGVKVGEVKEQLYNSIGEHYAQPMMYRGYPTIVPLTGGTQVLPPTVR